MFLDCGLHAQLDNGRECTTSLQQRRQVLHLCKQSVLMAQIMRTRSKDGNKPL